MLEHFQCVPVCLPIAPRWTQHRLVWGLWGLLRWEDLEVWVRAVELWVLHHTQLFIDDSALAGSQYLIAEWGMKSLPVLLKLSVLLEK